MNTALIVASLLALAPGRYAGDSPAGLVWVWLNPDGSARFGGVDCAWRQEGEILHLDGPTPLALRVVTRAGRACLEGPPFERICLTPAPLAPVQPVAPQVQPPALVGGWRHEASGGALDLLLAADGRYTMLQAATGDAAERTHGRWHGTAEQLTLIPDGGPPVAYRARRAGASLLIGGGDLPMEVRFGRVDAAPVR